MRAASSSVWSVVIVTTLPPCRASSDGHAPELLRELHRKTIWTSPSAKSRAIAMRPRGSTRDRKRSPKNGRTTTFGPTPVKNPLLVAQSKRQGCLARRVKPMPRRGRSAVAAARRDGRLSGRQRRPRRRLAGDRARRVRLPGGRHRLRQVHLHPPPAARGRPVPRRGADRRARHRGAAAQEGARSCAATSASCSRTTSCCRTAPSTTTSPTACR